MKEVTNMAEIVGKIFAKLSASLESLADGTTKHSSEEGFPTVINEKNLRERRQILENLRQKYDELMTETRKTYDEFSSYAKESKKEIAKIESLLYGFYGKKSQDLTDFGVSPWKTGSKKGPRKKEN